MKARPLTLAETARVRVHLWSYPDQRTFDTGLLTNRRNCVIEDA